MKEKFEGTEKPILSKTNWIQINCPTCQSYKSNFIGCELLLNCIHLYIQCQNCGILYTWSNDIKISLNLGGGKNDL